MIILRTPPCVRCRRCFCLLLTLHITLKPSPATTEPEKELIPLKSPHTKALIWMNSSPERKKSRKECKLGKRRNRLDSSCRKHVMECKRLIKYTRTVSSGLTLSIPCMSNAVLISLPDRFSNGNNLWKQFPQKNRWRQHRDVAHE